MAEAKKMVLKKGKEEKLASKKEAPKTSGRLEKAKKFFRGVKNELKKVHWPNRKQLLAYTGVTLVAVLIITSILWIFDMLLSGVLMRVF